VLQKPAEGQNVLLEDGSEGGVIEEGQLKTRIDSSPLGGNSG